MKATAGAPVPLSPSTQPLIELRPPSSRKNNAPEHNTVLHLHNLSTALPHIKSTARPYRSTMSLSPPLQDFALLSQGEGDDSSSQILPGKMSPAKLNLQRLYEQSRRGAPKKDAPNAAAADATTAGAPAKGKPRLLLMGQRRYVTLSDRVMTCS